MSKILIADDNKQITSVLTEYAKKEGYTVDVATDAIDRIHTTADSHSRVMVVEIMGHKAGWLGLYSAVAGGGDVCLIPEIPYDIKSVAKKIQERKEKGKNFSIVVVAEGALSTEEAKLDKKAFKKARAAMTQSIGYRVAKELEEAAWMDGAGPIRTFATIIVPSSSVAILTVSILSVIWHWNEYYLMGLYFNENRPLAVVLSDIMNLISLSVSVGKRLTATTQGSL